MISLSEEQKKGIGIGLFHLSIFPHVSLIDELFDEWNISKEHREEVSKYFATNGFYYVEKAKREFKEMDTKANSGLSARLKRKMGLRYCYCIACNTSVGWKSRDEAFVVGGKFTCCLECHKKVWKF